MQLDRERIAEIRKYFKPIDRKRIGEYIVEMRRQTALELLDMGMPVTLVGKTLGITHSTVIHYRKPEAEQKQSVVDVISEKRNEWIKSGQYPFTFHYTRGGVAYSDYILTDDPSKKPARVKEKKRTAIYDEIDKLIDSI